MGVLSEGDRAFWEENGYVVVHNAVPQENLDAVVDLVWNFLGMDRDDPDDWYREPHRTGGMVEVYQHQALWNNRQHPRVHEVFSEIWGTEKLWVSMDRANMKPPARPDKPDWDHKGMVHWDMDTSVPLAGLKVQGVLYLTDTAENQGGFQCVPGFHRTFEEWVKTQPEDRDPRRPNLEGLEVKAIPGKAGDLLIWHSLLPHGNGQNTSDLPRLAQYITMSPAQEDNKEGREQRIRMWREKLSPSGKAFPGDPRGIEQREYRTAELTELGEKLVGLRSWEAKR
ncbi:MAG: phytanoyl-CoA dioxygenase family protein [bacterium]|nr:phytanoyl-CoA dioxygenase family protein [bacterium]